MLVGERMTRPVITVRPETPIQDALQLMRTDHIRRAPVVDEQGRLVGIVAERDLLEASPSDATSLSIWEVHYLLSKITVERIMTRKVVTVTEDTPIEEAARVMADNKIGGLPVMRDNEVVGIVTETDLFKVFLELLGAREAGVRLSALIPDRPGELAKLTTAITKAGGNILALVVFLGQSTENRLVTTKVEGIDQATLRKLVEPLVERIVDLRTTRAS
ncbi:MAG TPA: CBS and ACT domain-containing protein [Anaerolineales bacterium]|nr:CBS and ACT domain-containing protein [Anaerolineales bacterium]